MERFLSSLGSIGPSRLLAALGVTGLVAAALFAIMFRMGGEEKALLYSGLSPKDASSVTEALDTASVKYQVSPDGSSVFVPRSKVAEARMKLAAEGVPGQGSVGYEIFDNQDALGSTSFVQNVNRIRALEGELARSIDSLDTVKDARVHLVIPERQLFTENQTPPTASIVIGLERGTLSARQIQAIRNLVAAAVPGLTAEKVTLTDERGEMLASAQVGGDAASGAMDDRKTQYEERTRLRLQEMLEGLVGPGAARVQVTAEMDLSQVSQTEESFDPDKVVPRSTHSIEETGAETNSDNAVTQGQNVPDGAQAAAGGNQSNNNRTDETVNYEISKTTKTQLTSPGTVTRLSVAVAVDGVSTPPAKAGGQPSWAPRSADEMARITALVRSAAGISDERGDKLEVANIRFARAAIEAGSKAPSKFDFDKNDIIYGVQLLALTIIAMGMIFFVAKPLVNGIFGESAMGGNKNKAINSALASMQLPQSASIDALPSDGEGTGSNATVDIARIQGSVNANAMKQVTDVVKENPEQTVAVVRAWLQERRA